MRRYVHLLTALVLVLAPVFPVAADMVFPSRVELVEVAPGLFDAAFYLPVRNQMRVKATVVLPPVCTDTAPREVTVSESEYAEVWQVRCDPESLAGQVVRVEGLLGSPYDVLLSIRTLAGRRYDVTLKPARASHVIPHAPTLAALSRNASVKGMADTFRRPDVLLLLWLVVLLDFRRRALMLLPVVGGVAYVVGRALADPLWLAVPPVLPVVVGLALTAWQAGHWAQGAQTMRGRRLFPWFAVALFGVLYGGAIPGDPLPGTLSHVERNIASCGYGIGVIAGLFIACLLSIELRKGLRAFPALRDAGKERPILGTLTGSVAMGFLFYQLATVSLVRVLVPSGLPSFWFVAILLGLYTGRQGIGEQAVRLVLELLLLAVGLCVGAGGVSLPGETWVVPASLFVLGVGLVIRRGVPRPAGALIAAVSLLYAGAQTGAYIHENMSRPVAQIVGSGLVAAFLLLFCSRRAAADEAPQLPVGLRLAGGCACLVALSLHVRGYSAWLDTTFATNYAMGIVCLPLLSVLLAGLAWLIWPRRSKVREHLNLNLRRPTGHWAVLALAIFLLGSGNIRVRNPWFTPTAPGPEQATRILRGVLDQTYSAFNLKDEEELYARLSENVGEDLVENLYLDSRRRLTEGLRQGSVVTVKDVSLKNVGERQRVEVCRALVTQPALVLGDEPTGNLDPGNRDHVAKMLFDYSAKSGAPLLVVTHDHELVAQFDRSIDISKLCPQMTQIGADTDQ